MNKKMIELKSPKKIGKIIPNKPKAFKPLKHEYKLSSQIVVYSNENSTKNIMKDGRTTNDNQINNNILSPKSTNFLKLKHKKKFKKKKIIHSSTMKSENDETKSKNLIKNNLKDGNEMIKNSNIDLEEKTIEIGKVSRRKITKLIFTKVDLYLCFLCIRKRKKIQNILIDEGMNLFSEKLDVINIFSKLMKIEDFENLSHKEKQIEMSYECKKRLQDINYQNNFK
jgi:hypothetical protein